MDTHVSLFVDNYADTEELLDASYLDNLNCAEPGYDNDEQNSPWQDFYAPVDAWARHALASNGFGGI